VCPASDDGSSARKPLHLRLLAQIGDRQVERAGVLGVAELPQQCTGVDLQMESGVGESNGNRRGHACNTNVGRTTCTGLGPRLT